MFISLYILFVFKNFEKACFPKSTSNELLTEEHVENYK